MKTKNLLSLLLLIILSIDTIKADLPIHCLKNQVVGEWVLKKGKTLATNNERKMVNCGHQSPDNESSSYKALNGHLDEVLEEELVTINPDFSVTGNKGHGKWTLIYDEGWEIDYNGTKYTHFFRYFDNNGSYATDCNNTLVGWFNSYHLSQRGCSQAAKKDQSTAQTNTNAPKNLSVVQPKDEDLEKEQDDYDFLFTKNDNDELFKKKDQLIQKSNDLFHDKSDYLIKNDYKQTSQTTFTSSSVKKSYSNEENIYEKNIRPYERNSLLFSSFSQMKTKTKTQEPVFVDHDKIVEKLNSIKGKTWKAGVSKYFEGLSLQKMNEYAGAKRHAQKAHLNKKEVFSFAQINTKKSETFSHYSMEDLSDLPKNFDWIKDAPKIIEQRDCGSCYAIATANMLTARNKIHNGDSTIFSSQHSIDCNYYNQGCQGGYGYLTNKFFSEFELVPESCHPYRATNGSCNTCDVSKLENVFKVTDYEYIGGAYGKCSERKMMEEIKKNGPIVVSFEPAMDFMYYQSGIYHSVDANDWVLEGEKELPQWEKVDHSVLCVGWGENEDGKYWILQNSWGESWGEKGYFKMRRGTDESNIESMGERAFVKKERRQQQFLQKQRIY